MALLSGFPSENLAAQGPSQPPLAPVGAVLMVLGYFTARFVGYGWGVGGRARNCAGRVRLRGSSALYLALSKIPYIRELTK